MGAKGKDNWLSGKRILVVEDEADVRAFVEMVLAEEGYEVAVAGDGQQALDEVRRRKPSLILLDMRLPVMDGWEFARRLHAELGESIPVVVMTALHDPSAAARQVHAKGYLRKPFDIDQLIATVQKNAT